MVGVGVDRGGWSKGFGRGAVTGTSFGGAEVGVSLARGVLGVCSRGGGGKFE
jgi:hypothetical protein